MKKKNNKRLQSRTKQNKRFTVSYHLNKSTFGLANNLNLKKLLLAIKNQKIKKDYY